jgi:hypothetical protein
MSLSSNKIIGYLLTLIFGFLFIADISIAQKNQNADKIILLTFDDALKPIYDCSSRMPFISLVERFQ